MNYLSFINQFWQLRREVPFSSVEADLYYYLLAVCNGLAWKNPFQQSNALIGATLGVSEKTLISARNRLKQYGLIDFQPGVKRIPSTYRLLLLENTLEKFQGIREECDSTNDSKSDSVSGRNTPDINKHKPNKTKAGANAPAECAPELVVAFERWQAWAADNAPEVLGMKTPLTAVEFGKLKAEYGAKMLEEVFLAMSNKPNLRREYKSAYLTAQTWCKLRKDNPKPGKATGAGITTDTPAPKSIAEKTKAQREIPL